MDEAQRTAEVEFLYLDLSSYGPCVASDASLREAIALLEPVPDQAGTTLHLRPVQVSSAGQAEKLRLESSPTIRVNGTDISGELAEAACGDCTTLSAGTAPVACAGVELEWTAAHRGAGGADHRRGTAPALRKHGPAGRRLDMAA